MGSRGVMSVCRASKITSFIRGGIEGFGGGCVNFYGYYVGYDEQMRIVAEAGPQSLNLSIEL